MTILKTSKEGIIRKLAVVSMTDLPNIPKEIETGGFRGHGTLCLTSITIKDHGRTLLRRFSLRSSGCTIHRRTVFLLLVHTSNHGQKPRHELYRENGLLTTAGYVSPLLPNWILSPIRNHGNFCRRKGDARCLSGSLTWRRTS